NGPAGTTPRWLKRPDGGAELRLLDTPDDSWPEPGPVRLRYVPRRAQRLLQQALSPARHVPEPDWTGFWPGIVRGIEQAKLRAPVRALQPAWRRPRWAI